MYNYLRLIYASISFSFLLYFNNFIIPFPFEQIIATFDTYNYHLRNRELLITNDTGEYVVEWDLSLGGKEFLLESPFLKAGLEQSIKDYINIDMECDNQIAGSASFYNVEIPDIGEGKQWRNARIEGNGKCKGNPTKCQRGVTESAGDDEGAVDDDDFLARNKMHFSMISRKKDSTLSKIDICEIFEGSTMFDIFEKILITASSFNYNVDVEVINDLSGSLNLNYNVTFQPASTDGLNQVNDVDLNPKEPRAVSTQCSESQCITQRSVMRSIFDHFGINFDENKHECLHQGVNCNSDDLVTHIWIGDDSSGQKSIPEFFGFLPSLSGLFLGGSQVVGTIPSMLGTLRKLKMLWLQDNALTGPIPTQIGNMRGLLELNLHGNQLTGVIPSALAKLKNLQLLNLGGNVLNGTIFDYLVGVSGTSNINSQDNCASFPNPLNKLGLNRLVKTSSQDTLPFPNLKVLSLYGNKLSGTMPEWIFELVNVVDLSLAGNKIAGELSTRLGDMRSMAILDLHENLFSGTIPWEMGNAHQLEVLNLYNNRFEKTIPKRIGRLHRLTELVLDNNLLSGPIPTQFGNLLNLKYLSFSGNRMSGEIPSELGNLISLSNLDIRGYSSTTQVGNKKMAGTIPSELGKLKAWKYVIFEGNSLQGPIPSEFGALLSSKVLWLKNQNLTGSIPAEIAKLESLSSLSIGGNSLTGTIPSSVGSLKKLGLLDMGSNSITGNIPEELANVSQLKYIGLGNLNITGVIPTSFKSLSSLEHFDLESNALTGDIPSELGELNALRVLAMGGNALAGPIPTQIGNLGGLVNLGLGGNNLTGGIPSELGTIKGLSSINLGGNALTGAIPSEFGEITQLQAIDLGGNKLTGSIPTQIGLIVGLSEIKLGDNRFTGAIPSEFGNLTGLKEMSLDGNKLTGSIPTELGNLELLEIIAIGENALSGPIPSELGGIKGLKSLSIGNNNFSGSMPSELENIESLVTFDLDGTNVTGSSWFMCSIKDFLPGDQVDLNCSDYCGTIDEECNATSIGEAKCMDVGCSGFGAPQCNALCRLDYSSCSAGSDEMFFHLNLQTDSKGWETTWEIRDSFDSVWESTSSYRSHATINEFRCMKRGCYFFELFDSGGDGLCCGENNDDRGMFSVNVDKDDIGRVKTTFGSSIVYDMGSCTDAPFPSTTSLKPSILSSTLPSKLPSIAPSAIPSTSPSDRPSLTPSLSPSVQPSSTPSLLPSTQPSSTPSSLPSTQPSSTPSSLPSTQPSSTPSSTPSDSPRPSSRPSLLPSRQPSLTPSTSPSGQPSSRPSLLPSSLPSLTPSSLPSTQPSLMPSLLPSTQPSSTPSLSPSDNPSSRPSLLPSSVPSLTPSSLPSTQPSLMPSLLPSSVPSLTPSASPSDNPSSRPSLPQLIRRMITREKRENAFFGKKVLLDNDLIYGSSPGSNNKGRIFQFELSGNFLNRFQGSEPNAEFGNDMAIFGDMLFVGIPQAGEGTGEVLVKSLSQSFTDIEILAPDASSAGDQRFGSSVAVSNDRIAIAAEDAVNTGHIGGVVYLFNRDDGFTFRTKILSPITLNGEENKKFGYKIAISGERIFITSMLQSESRGVLSVFDLDGNLIFFVSGFETGDMFGSSLAVKDDLLVVGILGGRNFHTGKRSGAAILYQLVGSPASSLLRKGFILPDDGGTDDNFGTDVAITSDKIIVSADNNSNEIGTAAGAIYVFDHDRNQLEKIVAIGNLGAPGDRFGSSIAVSEKAMVIGAHMKTLGGKIGSGALFVLPTP